MSFIERLSPLRRLKFTSITERRPQSVFFIERLSSLGRLKCTSITERRPQSVFFIERFFPTMSFIRSLQLLPLLVHKQNICWGM